MLVWWLENFEGGGGSGLYSVNLGYPPGAVGWSNGFLVHTIEQRQKLRSSTHPMHQRHGIRDGKLNGVWGIARRGWAVDTVDAGSGWRNTPEVLQMLVVHMHLPLVDFFLFFFGSESGNTKRSSWHIILEALLTHVRRIRSKGPMLRARSLL